MRRALVLSMVAALGCGGTQRPNASAPERPATPEETAAIQSVVFDGQRAGFVRHDADAYMAQWTDDAVIVSARQEEPGPHDLRIVRSRFEPARRMRFRGPADVLSVEFSDAVATVSGKTATLRTRTTANYRGGSETMAEIYRLRLTDAGWRVFENRFWRLTATNGDVERVFDASFYADADRRVEQERAADDGYELALALLDAGRPLEALAALRDLTEQQDVEAYDWVLRGVSALAVGDADDAEKSFAAALALDPDAPVPAYAR